MITNKCCIVTILNVLTCGTASYCLSFLPINWCNRQILRVWRTRNPNINYILIKLELPTDMKMRQKIEQKLNERIFFCGDAELQLVSRKLSQTMDIKIKCMKNYFVTTLLLEYFVNLPGRNCWITWYYVQCIAQHSTALHRVENRFKRPMSMAYWFKLE